MTPEEKRNVIVRRVLRWRKILKITDDKLQTGYLPEPSCEAFGEYHNLFFYQLLKTIEGYGGWNELQNSEILEGVYLFVTTGARGF